MLARRVVFLGLLFSALPLQSCFKEEGPAVALFKQYTSLKDKLPHITLCDLPTPITELSALAAKLGLLHLYMKRDDLTGPESGSGRLYGGNKPRKLEWLLAAAKQKGARTVMTQGCFGSNHALATAVYAKELGLKAILMLTPQPNSQVVRDNLLLDYASGAQLMPFTDRNKRNALREETLANDSSVHFIPTGGSTKTGCLGFVNAAFELYEQIGKEIIPEPDVIYVPLGSAGTTAGLLLGLALNNSKTKLVPVTVFPDDGGLKQEIKDLFLKTNKLLHDADRSIPLLNFPSEFDTNDNFCGTGYGKWTQESVLAIRLLKELEHIKLEGTYSAKAVNAFLEDVANGYITPETVALIWNTYCGLDFSHIIAKHSYKDLPEKFHECFEEDVQPLCKLAN